MSQSNADVVRALIPPPDTDLAPLIRDDDRFNELRKAVEQFVAPDVEATAPWGAGSSETYRGIEGFRQLWLDWLEPWESYHTEIEEIHEHGDRVAILIRDRGQLRDTDAEVPLRSGSLWEFRDGRIVRVEFFRNQAELLEAAGMSK